MIGALAILVAYLIGSIPFGLLVGRWFGKIDIRTVGSGNIGATNVGRTLGFRYFLLVFALDALKGFLPTWGLPKLLDQSGFAIGPDARVLIGLATILGHNFPAYLKFKGGKGVATSLGALLALDPVPSVAMLFGFIVFLTITKMVSAASLLAGVVFVYAHFDRTPSPWSPENRALSVVCLLLLVLVVARHRMNIRRIIKGEEPRVSFRKKRASGHVAAWVVGALVVIAAAGFLALKAAEAPILELPDITLREVSRAATGYQRSERIAFSPDAKRLFVTCPRYTRVLVYDPASRPEMKKQAEILLEGRPMAIWATSDRLYVLQRPNNDRRHVEEGWWDVYSHEGKPIGHRVAVGYYPDDIAMTGDGSHALVLLSGSAEGGSHRPAPSVTVIEMACGKVVGKVEFDAKDDPIRLALDAKGTRAAVSLQGSESVALIDMKSPASPTILAKKVMGKGHGPEAVRFDADCALLISDVAASELWKWTGNPADEPTRTPMDDGLSDLQPLGTDDGRLVCGLPFGSGIEILGTGPGRSGRLSIRGRTSFSATRPIGVAVSPEKGWIAVANRAGGSIHLIEIERRPPTRVSDAEAPDRHRH